MKKTNTNKKISCSPRMVRARSNSDSKNNKTKIINNYYYWKKISINKNKYKQLKKKSIENWGYEKSDSKLEEENYN